jgi:hypothetical protein
MGEGMSSTPDSTKRGFGEQGPGSPLAIIAMVRTSAHRVAVLAVPGVPAHFGTAAQASGRSSL